MWAGCAHWGVQTWDAGKERLIHYYAKFGFVDEGVSEKSTHGNVVWHQMRLTF